MNTKRLCKNIIVHIYIVTSMQWNIFYFLISKNDAQYWYNFVIFAKDEYQKIFGI